MPALLAAPWLVPLLTGVSAAAGLGTTAYNLVNRPSSSSSGPSAADAAKQAAALKAQQASAIAAQSGNTQQATGGSLTPASFTQTSAKAAGVPSDLNSIMQYLAGSGGTGSAPVSGGITTPNSGSQQPQNAPGLQNLSDLLKAA